MLFKRIRGQAQVLSALEKSVLNGDIEGSYLFFGPPSVGKFTTAKELAKYLTCTGVRDDTCRCENCRLFPDIPDYLEITKNGESINVSDIDALKEFITLVPYRARYRVCIIDDANNLNPTTVNELLKILEDLQENCIIILVSSQIEKLSPVLISRCYRIEFGHLSLEDIISILKSQGYDAIKVNDLSSMIPYMSGNVLRDFSKYSDQVNIVYRFLRDFKSKQADDTIALLEDFDSKQDLDIFIEILTFYLNDILKVHYGSHDTISNTKKLDEIMELTSTWKSDLCVTLLEQLKGVQHQMKKGINLRLLQYSIPVFCWAHYFMNKVHDDTK